MVGDKDFFFNGAMGYFRVTTGIARWTEGFTPPGVSDLAATYYKTMTAVVSTELASAGRGVFMVSVAEYLEAGDEATGIWFSRITDAVGIGATQGGSLEAVEQLASGLAIAAGVGSKAIFSEPLKGGVVFSNGAAAKMLAIASMGATVKMYTAGLDAGDVDEAIQTWCANLATSAHSRYSQYGFNSFARFCGKHYGCKSDGVFELGGDTDGADAIPWTVTLGETDFGMDAIKRLPYVYVGAKASGDLVLKVIEGPEQVHFFTVEMSSREARAGRAQLARGLSSRYWTIEIASDTERVELDALEFFPVKVSRRI